VLWHAQTLLREYRGDGHIATLLLRGIGPVEALVLHAAFDETSAGFLRLTRGWPAADWDEATDTLRGRRWLSAADVDPDTAYPPTLSPLGREVRAEIEDVTDRLATRPYEALGDEVCSELRSLARPFSRSIVDASGYGA
jgi:hypothetical protein